MKVVLGDGLSGLVYAFYNRDCILVGNDIPKPDNPFVYLHNSEQVSLLLDDLGLKRDVISVKVVLKDKHEILSEKLTAERSFLGTGRICSVGRDLSLSVVSIKESELCAILRSRIESSRLINDKCLSITENNIFLEKLGTIEYSELISTIHFMGFSNLYNTWHYGDAISIQDIACQEEPYRDKGNYFIYNDKRFKRIVCNSIIGLISKELKDSDRHLANKIYKNARFQGTIAPPPKNVIFVGRFANANPRWHICDSIFVAREGYSLSKMIAEQKRFDWIVTNGALSGRQEVDRRIRDLSLHLHSEITELIRETNYRTNLPDKTMMIKSTSILEELVDLLKLTLSVTSLLGFTEREIHEKFLEKSEINWEKILNHHYSV